MKTRKLTRLFVLVLSTLFAAAFFAACPGSGDTDDEPELESITAAYTQGATVVTPETSLDSLKSGLVVKAQYSDDTEETLNAADYMLSGTLTVGSAVTVTVTYEGETDTFTVNVTAAEPQNELTSISAALNVESVPSDTTLETLKQYLTVEATYSLTGETAIAAAEYTLGGTLTPGQTATITVRYGGEDTTVQVPVNDPADDDPFDSLPEVAAGHTRVYFLNATANWTNILVHAYIGETALTGAWGSSRMTSAVGETDWLYFDVPNEMGAGMGIIFANGSNDANRITVYLDPNSEKIWFVSEGPAGGNLTNDGAADRGFDSRAAAEAGLAPFIAFAELPEAAAEQSRIFFLNTAANWTNILVHAYIGETALTGAWGSSRMTLPVGETGWLYFDVPNATGAGMGIIIADGSNDANRITVYLDEDSTRVWFVAGGATGGNLTNDPGSEGDRGYDTRANAEAGLEEVKGFDDLPEVADGHIRIFFLNTAAEWTNILVHAFIDTTPLTGAWGSSRMTSAIGETGWLYFDVPNETGAGMGIILANGSNDANRITVYLDEDSTRVWFVSGGPTGTNLTNDPGAEGDRGYDSRANAEAGLAAALADEE